MTVARSAALDILRAELLALDPAGDDGFEGLMATLLARQSRVLMRLAKSGSQFGRDGTTPFEGFAVAMEGKRYRDDMRTEELAGKISTAEHVLADKVDLYVLGITAALGDQSQQFLRDLLAAKGITLLTFDWSPHPIPPLAVALALDPASTLSWFEVNARAVDRTRLQNALDEIRRDPSFGVEAQRIRDALSAPTVGFEPLRRHAERWLEQRFRDPVASQEAFGQFVTVADAAAPPIPRLGALGAFATELRADGALPRVVVVLGDEGMGKTWLTAHWWAGTTLRPVTLFVAGRRAERLDVRDPLGSLAALLAEQHEGRVTDAGVARWLRRLQRWKVETPPATPRVVVMLDGINEHQAHKWADLIGSLAREVHELGGVLVVTSRPAFWGADVRPRLRRGIEVVPVLLAGYSDPELTVALAPAGVRPEDLPEHVREFVRNPRVCRVAVDVLQNLRVAPRELTVERLLIDYWRHRLQERGDLIAHNVTEFHSVIRRHAREWLESPARPFDRTEWARYVTARRDEHDVQNDLTEIQEGRFLTVRDPDAGEYEFRPEVLPFALGLLITDEVRRAVAAAGGDGAPGALPAARAPLTEVLDPIRGFDVLSDVIAAAVGLACLDPRYPAAGRTALAAHWLSLQNVSATAAAGIEAAFLATPEPFLSALELEDRSIASANATGGLVDLLLRRRDDPRLARAVGARIATWLGRWAHHDRTIGDLALDERRRAEHDAKREASLAGLGPAERAFVQTNTTALESRGASVDLDRVAALLLASRPLAGHTAGLVAWAFATLLTADVPAGDDVQWVCRFNRRDPVALRSETDSVFAALGDPSDLGRRAHAFLLHAMGDLDAAAAADALSPRTPGWSFRRAAQFCDTDPFDPQAAEPTNLDAARAAADSVEPSKAWVARWKSTEDIQVDDALPGLARFDLARAVAMLRRQIVLTAPDRGWEATRALSWHLAELSPLFDDACVAALEALWERLLADAEHHAREDYPFVITLVHAALAPHRTPEAQLAQLLRLPATVTPYDQLKRGLVPLADADAVERALADASGNVTATERVLLFLTAAPSPLTDAARDHLFAAVTSDEERVGFIAAEAIRRAHDEALDARLLTAALAGAPPFGNGPGERSYWVNRAVASAVIRRDRTDALAAVDAQFQSAVAAHVGAAGDTQLIAVINLVLPRLLDPATPDVPPSLGVTVETSSDELSLIRRFDTLAHDPEQATELLTRLSNDEMYRRLREDEANRAQFDQLETALDAAGATALLQPPPARGLAGLVTRHPDRVKAWVDLLLAELSDNAFRRAGHFAYAIASAYSHHDANGAARLFARVDESALPITLLIGLEAISLRDHALFLATADGPFGAMRRERFDAAFSDADLSSATLAAELSGNGAWLDAYVDGLLASPAAGDIARGIMVSGFRRAGAHADAVLGQDWGGGFLGDVASHARDAYNRAMWAETWLEEAGCAADGPAFWRTTYLAVGVSDARALRSAERVAVAGAERRFHVDLFKRTRDAAKNVQNARKSKLFGMRAPEGDLVALLQS